MPTVLALEILTHLMVRHGHLPRLALPCQPVDDKALHGSDLINRLMIADQLYRSMMTTRTLFVFLVFDPKDLKMRNEPT